MDLGENLLFFFSALGAFNSFLLGGYLFFFGKEKPLFQYLLASLLLLLSIRAGVSCVYFFGEIPKGLVKLGMAANLLLGLVTYFLVRFQLSKSDRKKRYLQRSLVVQVFLLIGSLIVLAIAFDFWVWDFNIRYTLHTFLTIYLVAAGVQFFYYKRQNSVEGAGLWEAFGGRDLEVFIIYLGVVSICFGFAVSLFISYILGPLLFSFFFYAFTMLVFRRRKQQSKDKSYRTKLDQAEVNVVVEKLQDLMEQEKIFKDPTLTMERVCKRLGVSRHFLSQMLNDNMKLSYSELVSYYRIEEACQMLLNHTHYNLEAIAYEVGFNSKSSFYTAFKKLKGITPSQYRSKKKHSNPVS
ncbi:MAG: helix-turn-helix transcriptional regulator [Bacteroidota bacterium]